MPVEIVDQSETPAPGPQLSELCRGRTIGQSVPDALVGTPGVVVLDVGFDQIPELPLTEDDEPV